MLAGLGAPSSPFPGTFGGQQSQIEALLAQYGNRLPQSQQSATAITDLDEFMGSLSSDERKGVEKDERYMRSKIALIETYLVHSISSTQDGYNFVTGPGRKLAQDLLDNAKKAHEHVEAHAKDELTAMQEAIKQQQTTIDEQNQLMSQQRAELEKQRADFETLKATLGD